MFGISSFEFLIILLVAVVVLGPEKLPKIMRTVTKIMSEFRRVSTDLQRTMNAELNFQEEKEREALRRKEEEAQIARQARERALAEEKARTAEPVVQSDATAPASTTAVLAESTQDAASPIATPPVDGTDDQNTSAKVEKI